MNEILNNLYYKDYNFDGANSLHEKAKKINPKITIAFVREWLKKQSTSQVFYKKVGKKQFLPIYSEAPHNFQIDLTFFPRISIRNSSSSSSSILHFMFRSSHRRRKQKMSDFVNDYFTIFNFDSSLLLSPAFCTV